MGTVHALAVRETATIREPADAYLGTLAGPESAGTLAAGAAAGAGRGQAIPGAFGHRGGSNSAMAPRMWKNMRPRAGGGVDALVGSGCRA
jgi:hypothetical protein